MDTALAKVVVPIFEFTLPEDEMSVDEVHRQIEEIIKNSEDARGRKTDVKAHMTAWNMAKKHRPFKIISNTVEEIIKAYHAQNSDLDLETCTISCWGGLYRQNDYSEEHGHFPAIYAFVYYVKVDENSSPLIFPECDDYTYRPKTGHGVIFPGYLLHHVPPQEIDQERIIVAGNVEGTGSVGYPQRNFFEAED